MRCLPLLAATCSLLPLAALLFAVTPVRAEFPAVSELPAHPDLPDPLVMFNGERVTSKEQWLTKRRPELKDLFTSLTFLYR
jgi:hypothetical protein